VLKPLDPSASTFRGLEKKSLFGPPNLVIDKILCLFKALLQYSVTSYSFCTPNLSVLV